MLVTKKGAGTTCRRERMRCKDCRKKKGGNGRFTLPKPLKEYVTEVCCPRCRSTNVASNEDYRQKEMRKYLESGNLCMCEAIPFRHRKGSLRFCAHHPDTIFGVPPTEEEIEKYEAMLLTKRSADEYGHTDRAAANDEIPF